MEVQTDFSKCICLIAIGMSGTGKTTFVNKFQEIIDNNNQTKVHTINLDPAVRNVSYKPFVDIRATHEYKKIMKQYKLGPNGAIMTALNLFTAQPEFIVKKIQDKVKQNQQFHNIILIDIPGQIQVFTWSASSMILTQAISTMMPVKLLYIIDSVRCQNPNVFLSNLLFAQSIHVRLRKFDFMLLMNKTDCADGELLKKWLTDYEQFTEQLNKDPSYMSTLSKSIVIHLSDFYEKMEARLISAKTGKGFQQLQQQLFAQKKSQKPENSVNEKQIVQESK